MTLKTTVEHDSTELEIDLDALDRYGSYYVDPERGLIINASVYTHGTPDSRHLRGDTVCGTDYTFESVDVDREQVREHIRDELNVEISDDTLDTAIAEYQAAGLEAIGGFDKSLDHYRILSKATNGVISTDTNEPLAGWERTIDDFIDRVEKENAHVPRRKAVRIVFNALRKASPGDCEYSTRIALVNTTQ